MSHSRQGLAPSFLVIFGARFDLASNLQYPIVRSARGRLTSALHSCECTTRDDCCACCGCSHDPVNPRGLGHWLGSVRPPRSVSRTAGKGGVAVASAPERGPRHGQRCIFRRRRHPSNHRVLARVVVVRIQAISEWLRKTPNARCGSGLQGCTNKPSQCTPRLLAESERGKHTYPVLHHRLHDSHRTAAEVNQNHITLPSSLRPASFWNRCVGVVCGRLLPMRRWLAALQPAPGQPKFGRNLGGKPAPTCWVQCGAR